MMRQYQFTAQIEKDKESGMYVGYIPNLPGAHTQGKTMDELYENLREVAELVLECLNDEEKSILENEFIGTREVKVAI